MNAYRDRPWLAQYRAGQTATIEPEPCTVLGMFRASVERTPGPAAIRSFEGEPTSAQLDQASDALALALLDRGLQPGDRHGRLRADRSGIRHRPVEDDAASTASTRNRLLVAQVRSHG